MSRMGLSGVVCVAYLLASGPDASAAEASNVIRLSPVPRGLALQWQDAEDQLQGFVTPAIPREGAPLEVTLRVGSIQGPPFDGAVTFTLRAPGATSGETHTLPYTPAGVHLTVVPTKEGLNRLDILFRTTRTKVVRVDVLVQEGPLRMGPVLAALLAGVALLVAVGGALARRRGHKVQAPPP